MAIEFWSAKSSSPTGMGYHMYHGQYQLSMINRKGWLKHVKTLSQTDGSIIVYITPKSIYELSQIWVDYKSGLSNDKNI